MNLEQAIKGLNSEEVIMLVHGYDHHIISCERSNKRPMFLLEYYLSDEYRELVDSEEIFDNMEYESDLEDISLAHLHQLALSFAKKLEEESPKEDTQCFTKLDWMIDDLELGVDLSEDEKEKTRQFNESIIKCGYIPTEDGALIQAKSEQWEHLHPSQFVWDDSELVHRILTENPETIYVSTYQAEGNTTYVSQGRRIANRLGYFLTSKPLLEIDDSIAI